MLRTPVVGSAPVEPPAAAPPGVDRLTRRLVVGSAAVGVALRVWVLASPLGRVDDDEAVVGLIVRAFLFDRDPRTFFWGQSYGGTQEAVVASVTTLLVPSATVGLKVAPILLHALASWLVWRLGLRLLDPARAAAAAALSWVFPAVFVWWSTKERGFYGVVLVLGVGALLLAHRYADRPSGSDAALLGGALGVGVWASPQIALFAVPAVLWVAGRTGRAALGHLPVAALAALVGASPWIVYNLERDWVSLEVFADGAGLATDLARFTEALPLAHGLRAPFSLDWLLPAPVGIALPLVVVVAGVVATRRGRAALGLPLLFLGTYPLVWGRQHFVFRDQYFEPRYLYYLLPALALVLAASLTTSRRRVAATIVASCLSAAGISSLVTWGEVHREDWQVAPREVGPVADRLVAEGALRVYAPWGDCYRLSLLSEERVTCSPLSENRHAPFDLAVLADPAPDYVLPEGHSAAGRLEGVLDDEWIDHEVIEVGDYDVYLLDDRVVPVRRAFFVGPIDFVADPRRG